MWTNVDNSLYMKISTLKVEYPARPTWHIMSMRSFFKSMCSSLFSLISLYWYTTVFL